MSALTDEPLQARRVEPSKFCAICARPAPLTLCWDHTKQLGKALTTLVWLIPEVQVEVTRQTKKELPVRRAEGDMPLVFDCEASEVAWIIDNTVRAWAEEVGCAPTAAELRRRVIDLAQLLNAPQCLTEMQQAVKLGFRQVDRSPVRLYIGDCECGQRVYARIDDEHTETECRGCGETYNIEASRQKNQEYGRDYQVTAREAVQYLGAVHGRQLTVDRICTWARRGKFESVGVDQSGQKLYRLGDIIETAESLGG
jgi:hypothetical protein